MIARVTDQLWAATFWVPRPSPVNLPGSEREELLASRVCQASSVLQTPQALSRRLLFLSSKMTLNEEGISEHTGTSLTNFYTNAQLFPQAQLCVACKSAMNLHTAAQIRGRRAPEKHSALLELSLSFPQVRSHRSCSRCLSKLQGRDSRASFPLSINPTVRQRSPHGCPVHGLLGSLGTTRLYLAFFLGDFWTPVLCQAQKVTVRYHEWDPGL